MYVYRQLIICSTFYLFFFSFCFNWSLVFYIIVSKFCQQRGEMHAIVFDQYLTS